MHSTSHSFAIEQFQHLPNPYPHDAIRDSFIRSNIVNLDLASPPPPRFNPRTHPLTPPDSPGHSRTTAKYYDEHNDEEVPFSSSALDAFLSVGLLVDVKSRPTRYLVLGGVPTDTPASTLSRVFSRLGDLKGMFVRYQKDKGIVVLSWHDTRHAKKAHSVLSTTAFFGRKEPLSVAFISPFSLIKATGKSPFVNGREGNLTIVAEQTSGGSNGNEPVNLHAAFALFGELSTFLTDQGDGTTTYYASYYDAREAANAVKALRGRSMLGMRIHITEGIPEDEAADQEAEQSLAPPVEKPLLSRSQPAKMQYSYSSVACRRVPADQLHRSTTKPSASSPITLDANAQPNSILTPLSPSSTASPGSPTKNRPVIYRTSQNNPDKDNAPSKGTTIFSTGPPRNPRALPSKRSNNSSRSNSPGTNLIPRTLPPRLSLPFLNASTSGIGGPINPNAAPFTPSALSFDRPHPPISFNPSFFGQPLQGSPTSIRGSIPSLGTGPSTIESGLSTPINTLPSGWSPALSKRSSIDHFGSAHHSRDGSFEKKDLLPPVIFESDKRAGLGMNMPVVAGNERNAVDIAKIEAGLDTRTTVMLKNVPNKMSDVDLRKYINEIVPNSFDFVYLRFDFQSSANVGYAFVNFVEVSNLLAFAKARLGVKWNMFCSEKVLQMSYANFQGKEALVEKFKNSCVMDMQDEWVPKIFYSSGPKKGQREPFPPPTNQSRARRGQGQRERGILRTNHSFFTYKPLSLQQ